MWNWTDMSFSNFFRWAPGQPDNRRGNEQCAQVYRKGRPRDWSDVPCAENMDGFICKRSKIKWI
ncbi:hypothetical protein TELCIR_23794 [Teladorsagia circumcincta]|uniref:C-type lectin domain-containing protein n=1 Tax=Teladorsagia circumcincta TaxID=45464 RepID=A0A2G9TBB4_TELCI|nr:hypothetical protein TELCIR_23794 [Teladorsagia circumcincta]